MQRVSVRSPERQSIAPPRDSVPVTLHSVKSVSVKIKEPEDGRVGPVV